MNKRNVSGLAALLIGLCAQAAVEPAKYLNEWTFERDGDGTSLHDAINSGTNSPLAQFDAGFASTVFTTNSGVLRCIGEDAGEGTDGVWTNGARLNAPLTGGYTAGQHFLRYDLEYSVTNDLNNSGTVLGVYFTGDSGAKAAGMVLGYSQGDLEDKAAAAGRVLTPIPGAEDIAKSGTLTAIAEVDLDAVPQTLKVWYDLSGSNSFTRASPAFTTNISITTLDNLRFHATGDFQPAGSDDYAEVDNIRHAATWDEITYNIFDIAADPELIVTMTDSQDGAMDLYETNTVRVVIENIGGPATDVTSTLTPDSIAGLTVISSNNAPQDLAFSVTITNTYQVVANAESGAEPYRLTAVVSSAEAGETDPVTISVVVGSRVVYVSNSITEDSGGVLTGKYEPGETLTIEVVSTNNGARTVSNIVNRLTARSAGFEITPASDSYPEVTVGASTSSVYQVKIGSSVQEGTYFFDVENSASLGSWTDSFTLDVFNSSIPSVPADFSMTNAIGEALAGSIVLTNEGNQSVTYQIVNDGSWPAADYLVVTQDIAGVEFDEYPVESEIFAADEWDGNNTLAKNIDFFDMSVFGATYTRFSVSRYGQVTLENGSGGQAVIKPFSSSVAVEQDSIRYRQTTTNLVVSWDTWSTEMFQVVLNSDGTIQYIYGGPFDRSGTVGISNTDGNGHSQTIDYVPTSQGLLLTPASWVTLSPLEGDIAAVSENTITIEADAAGIPAGTYTFTANVIWSNGDIDPIEITIVVEERNPNLELPATPPTFYGPAGWITSTNIVVTNSGNASLTYRITDTGLADGGYELAGVTGQTYYVTNGLFYPGPVVTREALYDESQSPDSVDANKVNFAGAASNDYEIGFPFTFFGRVYTNLTVWENGTISLGDEQVIMPFSDSLTADSSTEVYLTRDGTRFVVAWANLLLNGTDRQTFEAAINRSGVVRFQYLTINGEDWPEEPIQIKDQDDSVAGTLVNEETSYEETHYTTETNTVYYDEYPVPTVTTNGTNTVLVNIYPVGELALEFIPERQVISASPTSGTIPANGGTATIKLTGDARSLTDGGSNNVTNSTTLNFAYAETNKNLLVTFVATNSADGAYAVLDSAAKATMWGTAVVPDVSSTRNEDGSRTISWPAPVLDSLSRTYTVWFTTSLSRPFEVLPDATVTNIYSVTDRFHNAEPVIFYKVTVE